MPWLCALALLGCLLAGCSGTKSPAASSTSPRGSSRTTLPASATTNHSGLIVTPGGAVRGRVASVNAGARFVVVGFPLGSVPAVGKRLNVYRNGLKVGELKVTGPQRDTNTVADIVAGDCQVGDEAREE